MEVIYWFSILLNIFMTFSIHFDAPSIVSIIGDLKKVTIILVIISDTGVVPKDLHRSLEILGMCNHLSRLLQKAVILNTPRIIMGFLSQCLVPIAPIHCLTTRKWTWEYKNNNNVEIKRIVVELIQLCQAAESTVHVIHLLIYEHNLRIVLF